MIGIVLTQLSFSIQMHYVEEMLEKRMSTWNRDYDAAQMIFGPGLGCATVRAGVKLIFLTFVSNTMAY